MNKELQDLVWSILPKEFKEEVKKIYCTPGHRAEVYTLLQNLFGAGNLTSDAEGEVELLHVTRQKVMGLYANAKKLHDLYTNATCINGAESSTIDSTAGTMRVLKNLFGSKCLPDELTEDNFAKLHGDNLSPEPKAAPTFADDCKSRPDRTLPSYTSQPVTNCHRSDRLHIAAMAMQGLLSNAERLRKSVAIGSRVSFASFVAREALRYADALVAESHK